MMKVLTGIYSRDAGSLQWLGEETHFSGPKASQEAGIGIIHQELNLIPQLSIAENIFLGREFVSRLGRIDWKNVRRSGRAAEKAESAFQQPQAGRRSFDWRSADGGDRQGAQL